MSPVEVDMTTERLADHGADDEFVDYMVVFGSQRQPNVPEHSHTFAAFLRCTAGAEPVPVEDKPLSISWLPRTKVIVPWRLTPEPGRNFELTETMNWVLGPDPEDPGAASSLYAWGPFRIGSILRAHADARAEELGSGWVEYVVVDLAFRPNRASNCVHALSDLGLTTCLLHTLGSYGREASWKVVHYLGPWIQKPSQTYPDVRTLFGLDPYEGQIEYLQYQADAVLDFLPVQEGASP